MKTRRKGHFTCRKKWLPEGPIEIATHRHNRLTESSPNPLRILLETSAKKVAHRPCEHSKGCNGFDTEMAQSSAPFASIIPLSTSLACLSPNPTNHPSVGSRGHACLTP